MARHISERDLRRLERERRIEERVAEMEIDRDRGISAEERRPMNIEEGREELIRLRREMKERKRQEDLEKQMHEEYARRQDEERIQYEAEKRTQIEMRQFEDVMRREQDYDIDDRRRSVNRSYDERRNEGHLHIDWKAGVDQRDEPARTNRHANIDDCSPDRRSYKGPAKKPDRLTEREISLERSKDKETRTEIGTVDFRRKIEEEKDDKDSIEDEVFRKQIRHARESIQKIYEHSDGDMDTFEREFNPDTGIARGEIEKRKSKKEKEMQRSLSDNRTHEVDWRPHESTRVTYHDDAREVDRLDKSSIYEFSPTNNLKPPFKETVIPERTSLHNVQYGIDTSLHRTMDWIDDRFDRMHKEEQYKERDTEHRVNAKRSYEDSAHIDIDEEIENRKYRLEQLKLREKKVEVVDSSKNAQREIGYETDDEIEHTANRIEKMKLKQKVLQEELHMRKKKQEQREREKRLFDEYKKRQKEKRDKLLQLKKEENQLRERLKSCEETLDQMGFSDTDSEQEQPECSRKRTKETIHRYDGRSNRTNRRADITEERTQMKYPKLPKLTEEAFEQWKIEVEVMLESDIYAKEALLHAVRNSIVNATGNVRRVLPTIPHNASTRDILNKLENIYGDRRSGESHLSEFYRTKQMKGESVAEWGVRLENIVQKAENKGQIGKEQKNEMLKKRFWKYLYDEKLKLNTRIIFERCDTFEELLKEIRIEERELSLDSDSSDKRKQGHEESSTLHELVDRMERIENELKRANRDDQERNRSRYERPNERWGDNYQRGRPMNRWRNDRRSEENRRYSRREDSGERQDRFWNRNDRGYNDRDWRHYKREGSGNTGYRGDRSDEYYNGRERYQGERNENYKEWRRDKGLSNRDDRQNRSDKREDKREPEGDHRNEQTQNRNGNWNYRQDENRERKQHQNDYNSKGYQQKKSYDRTTEKSNH